MVDQTSQFYAILTNVGAAKQANADALGIAWKIIEMAVGDGNPGNVDNPALPQPSANWTALLNEWRRAPLNQLKVDDKDSSIIVAEQIIPADVGGRWIREIGLYDADGDLVAVANCAPTYKPLLSQGSGRTQVVRMNLIVSSSSNVQLKIDPSVVLATREWVESEVAKQDFKNSVLVATTANIVLSGLQTIDGIVLTAGARVLVKNQDVAKDNGLYTVAASAWIRCTDADTNAKVTPGLVVTVERGTINADSVWQLITDGPVSLGLTLLTFEPAFGLLKKAPLGSPVFTGDPKAPTVAATDNDTSIATTAFVRSAMALFGLGSAASKFDGNIDTVALTGVYLVSGNEGTLPTWPAGVPGVTAGSAITGGTLFHMERGSGSAATQVFDAFTSADVAVTMIRTKRLGGTWLPWREIWTSGNTPKQTSLSDTDAGKMLTTGSFGLGAAAIGFLGNIDAILATGFYMVSSGTLGTKPVNSNGSVIAAGTILHIERGSSSAATQIWDSLYGDSTTATRFVRSKNNVGVWSGWEEIITAGHIATKGEVETGSSDVKYVTPKKLRLGFAFSYSSNGYLAFPTWLGGLIIQWSNGQINAGAGTAHITLPLAFTASLVAYSFGTSAAGVTVTGQSASTTGIDVIARTVSNGSIVVPGSIVGYTFICIGK